MYVHTYMQRPPSLSRLKRGKEYTVVNDAFEGGLDVCPCPVAAPLGGKEERKREKCKLQLFFACSIDFTLSGRNEQQAFALH